MLIRSYPTGHRFPKTQPGPHADISIDPPFNLKQTVEQKRQHTTHQPGVVILCVGPVTYTAVRHSTAQHSEEEGREKRPPTLSRVAVGVFVRSVRSILSTQDNTASAGKVCVLLKLLK